MSYSNSSLNCFTNCMRKYELAYIKHAQPCMPPSPHLVFGAMAHEVLYNAGRLRDDVADNVVDNDEYYSVIPSEVIHSDLKKEFNIPCWETYFTAVIKETAKIEQSLIKELQDYGHVHLRRELVMTMTPDEMYTYGLGSIGDSFKGIIDLLLYTKDYAIIIDYKFSNSRKTQSNFDMDSQLYLYAMFVHFKYDIPLHNIKIGYIDIPKKVMDKPIVLKNGTLSRAKSQNISAELYKAAVEAIHGDDPVYNCEKGGYYYECYCEMKSNAAAYLNIRYVDFETYEGITRDLLNTAKFIDKINQFKLGYPAKYDSYSCANCEYITHCKPWLVIGGKNENL